MTDGTYPSYSRVAFKVSVADCFNQLLGDFDNVLFPHCRTQKNGVNVFASPPCRAARRRLRLCTSGIFILDGGVCALRWFLQKQDESRWRFTASGNTLTLNIFYFYEEGSRQIVTLTPSVFLFPLFPPEQGMKTKMRKISRVTKKGTKADKRRDGIVLRADSKQNFTIKPQFLWRREGETPIIRSGSQLTDWLCVCVQTDRLEDGLRRAGAKFSLVGTRSQVFWQHVWDSRKHFIRISCREMNRSPPVTARHRTRPCPGRVQRVVV